MFKEKGKTSSSREELMSEIEFRINNLSDFEIETLISILSNWDSLKATISLVHRLRMHYDDFKVAEYRSELYRLRKRALSLLEGKSNEDLEMIIDIIENINDIRRVFLLISRFK